MNQFEVAFRGFRRCLVAVPLPIIALMLYLGLRSSTILPYGLHQVNGIYHPAYFGWYDFVLAYSIVFSFFTGSLQLKIKDLLPVLVGFCIISISWISTYEADRTFIIAGLICFCRFAIVFVLGKALVRKLGYRTAENILLALYGILAVSAVLWYSIQFGGVQNRMAASAMTSASFGQVSAIMCLIFYARKYYSALFFSFIFLFLSFSRTSLLLFLLLIFIQNRRLIPLNLIKYVVGFVFLVIIGVMLMQQYGGEQTQVVLESRLSMEEVSNLNGRSEIWSIAIDQIEKGEVPWTGVGFHMTPSLIKDTNLKFIQYHDVGYFIPSHYHNMLIEYTLSLGVLALIIFLFLITRIWQTFRLNCCPAFYIYAFFFFSQAMDYTIFAPKETVIFAIMLGLAEGQFEFQRAKSCQLKISSSPASV